MDDNLLPRDGHGPLWRRWAELAMARFPELPVIDRCHAYAIRTKYSYRWENVRGGEGGNIYGRRFEINGLVFQLL